MKILGNRLLVSKVEEPKQDGFSTVEVQDTFVYKGKVEQVNVIGISVPKEGDIVLFCRNSPDTQDVEHNGQTMKIIRVEDVLAIL